MYYILNNISNFSVYISYLRRLSITRITIYTPYTYYCKQIGYNRRGYRNRRKELEVVVVDNEREDKEEISNEGTISSEDGLA